MPRKGKSDLINEDNLIQSKKILDDIVKLLMKAEDAQKDSAQQFNIKKQIFAQLERYAEISNKNLNRYNITLSSTFSQLESVVDIFRESLDLQEQQNSRIDERLKQLEEENKKLEEQKQLYQKLDSDMAKYKQKMTDISNLKYKSPVQKLKDSLNDQLSQTQQSISDMTDSIIQKHKKNGTYTQENLGMIQNEIKNTLKDNGLTDQLGKVNVTMTILNETLGVIRGALNIVTDGIKKGINIQSGVYNRTYQDISTRTGTDNPTYFRNQAGTYTNLISQGLADNIKVSDVQQMWDTMAKTGSNEQDMYANAIENVITKNIVPYLDTTSKSFTILNNRFDGNFTKQIRGINAANLEIAGNNYATQDMMQTIIDQIQPMSDKAVEDLAQGSAEVTAMINKMIDQGWSEDAAKSYATQLFKSQRYGDQIMRSGSVSEKYAMISAIDQGVNIYDPTQYNDFMGLAVDTDKMLMSGMPGYNSTLNGMITNFGGTAMGIDFSRAYGAMYAKGSGNQLANDSNLTPAQLAEFARKEQERLKNNETQTSFNRQETTLQNLGTFLAIGKEYMGKYYDLLVSILGAVKNITLAVIGAKIGGNILKGIGGKGIGTGLGKAIGSGATYIGAGLANGFSKAAPTAIGAGKIGAFTGTAGAIAGAAGVAAGGAMAVKGGLDIYNDIKNDNVNAGTALSGIGAAGGIAGAGALIALGASNPIGWVALAVGAAGLIGRQLYEINSYTGDITKELNKENENQLISYKEKHKVQEMELEALKTQLSETDDLEKRKQLIIDAGIATEEELQDSRYKQKDALIALTEQYLKSTKQLNQENEEQLKVYQKSRTTDMNDISTALWDMIKNNDYDKLNDTQKQAAESLYNTWYMDLQQKSVAGTLTDDEKFRWEKMLEDKNKYSMGTDMNNDKLKMMTGQGWGNGGQKESQKIFSQNMVNDQFVDALLNYSSIREVTGKTDILSSSDLIALSELTTELKNAKDAKEAQSIADKIKAMGVKSSQIDSGVWNAAKTKWDLKEFRYGTDSIPYDGFPAILHQGEAVLTASTANEMRGLVDEYRDSKNESSNFDVIIESQTVAIIDKMDEIIAIMNNNSNTITESAARSFVNSAKEAQMNNMIRMKNSKSLA